MNKLQTSLCILLCTASGLGIAAGTSQFTPPITERPSATLPDLPEFTPETPVQPLQMPEQDHTDLLASDVTLKIQVKSFRFEGNKVFSDATLQTIAAPYAGRAITISELEELRYRLSQYYVDNGYPNSGAILPDQQFEDGILIIQIVEGRLNEIRISGTERLDADYVRDRLLLGAGPPLNTKDLEERFQLLLEDPLIERMEGRLSPGLTPGESILDLKVERAKPYLLGISSNNYRPPSTGAEQGELFGLLRNLTGYGDTLDFSTSVSAGSVSGSGGFSIPVTRYDTQLFVRGSYSRSEIIEKPLDEVNIKNKFWSIQLGFNQPIYRSLERSFYLGARFEVRKNRNKLDGARFSFQKVRKMELAKPVCYALLKITWKDSPGRCWHFVQRLVLGSICLTQPGIIMVSQMAIFMPGWGSYSMPGR